MYYYYFSPSIEQLDKSKLDSTYVYLCIMDDTYTVKYSAKHVGVKRIAQVIDILKGSKRHAVLNMKSEDKDISDLAQFRIKYGKPILNAYECFNKRIMNVNQHFLKK